LCPAFDQPYCPELCDVGQKTDESHGGLKETEDLHSVESYDVLF